MRIITPPKGTHKPKIYKSTKNRNGYTVFILKNVSRKRLIKVAMALGVPAREARLMAKTVNDRGLSYKQGLPYILRSIKDVTDKEYIMFWLFIWDMLDVRVE